MEKPKKKIYIACPYTQGSASINIRNSVFAAEALTELGFVPYNPLLTHLWMLIAPHNLDFWYQYDNEWLPLCDAVLRLHGESQGADQEVRLAQQLGIPVCYSIDEVIHAFET